VVFDIIFGQESRKRQRQIDCRRIYLSFERVFVSPALLFYRFFQQPHVQLKTDSRNLAALLRPLKIARAPDFQVFDRNFKTCAEFLRLQHSIEPLLGILAHHAARFIQEVGVGPVGTAPGGDRGWCANGSI